MPDFPIIVCPCEIIYLFLCTYDISNNILTITDVLGRLALSYVYDLSPNPKILRVESIDAGMRRTIFDAAMNMVEQRDTKGSLLLRSFDPLSIPIRMWARDILNEPITLRERIIYGDDNSNTGLTVAQTLSKNLSGKVYKHYDEGGLLTFEEYDFRGNISEKVRQVINDDTILAAFNPTPPNWVVHPFRVNWEPATGVTLDNLANDLLENILYHISFKYDALNRIRTMQYPQDLDGSSSVTSRKIIYPHYNKVGRLDALDARGNWRYQTNQSRRLGLRRRI